MAGDTGRGGQDIGEIMVNWTLVVKESSVVQRVASCTGIGPAGGIAIGSGDQHASVRSVTGGAIIGFVDSDRPIALVVATNTFGGRLKHRCIMFWFSRGYIVIERNVKVKISSI